MDTVCEIIKNYIKSNSVEEVIEYIRITPTEEFETVEEQKQYILDKLMDIDEIISIYNITIESLNYIVADLHIANYIKIKLMIGIIKNSSSDCYWHICTKAIVKYLKN